MMTVHGQKRQDRRNSRRVRLRENNNRHAHHGDRQGPRVRGPGQLLPFPEYLTNRTITEFNFDHPDAFDTDLLFEQLQALKSGRAIQMPQYDFVHHRRREDSVLVEPRRLVIFEGIMIYFDKRVRDLIDLKLYVDTPDDIRFIRRLRRDITERGRTVESVINQYMEKVRPGHYEFVEPTKAYADLVIPEGGFNERAMEALIPFLRQIAG
jgi:uridine kinase